MPLTGWSQARNYTFAPGTGGALNPMTGATQLIGANVDDTPSALAPIGFNFLFEGIAYTQFSVSPDGFMRLGNTAASSQFTNVLNSTTNIPKLAPYWDDLATGTTGNVRYLLSGASPNRTLTVQWFVTVPRNTTGPATATYQVSLSETTNVVQYTYGAVAAGTSYSVGLRGAETVTIANGFLSVTTSAGTATNTAANDAQTAAIAAGTTYTFTPPTCNGIVNLNVGTITTTTASASFTVTGATNYTVTTTPASTTQTVTASPVGLTGLTAGTSYTVNVVSNCGGGTSSATVTRAFTTTANCAAPTALATNTVTGNSANLTFTNAASGVNNYTVTTTPASTTQTVNSATTGSPVALTGLTAGTPYTVRVVSNCTAGGTSPAATTTFTTTFTCAASTYATLPVAESFENAWISNCALRDVPSLNWKNTPATGNPSWRRDDDGAAGAWSTTFGDGTPTGAQSTTRSARFHNYNATASGSFDLYVNLNVVGFKVLNFDLRKPDSNVITVLLSTDGGLTFPTTLATFPANSPAAFTSQTLTLPGGSTSGSAISVVRFLSTGTNGFTDSYLDNVVLQAVACPAPALAATTGVAFNQATVNWTALGGGTYRVSYGPAGFTPGSGVNEVVSPVVTGTSYTITGLMASTAYDYYVQQDCANTSNGVSQYSAKGTFTTTAACPTPTLNPTTNVTNTSATVNYAVTAGGGTFSIRYAPTGTAGFTATTGGTVVSAPVGSTSANLTGLTVSTAYTFYVTQDCTGSSTGSGAGVASAPGTFTTNVNPPSFTTSRSTGITYNSIASTGLPFTFAGTSTDDNTSAAVALPVAAGAIPAFAFSYQGTAITQFKVCTNGWITVDGTQTSTTFNNALGSTPPSSAIAPFWEDMVCQGNPSTAAALTASMKYLVTGSSPNRVLTVEWIGMEKFLYAGPSLNFQVKLYETSNNIEYVYGNMTGFDGTAGANTFGPLTYSIGLNGANNVANGNYLALQAPNTNYFLNADAGTANTGANGLSVTPACFSSYLLAPGTYATGAAPVVTIPANNEPAGAIGLDLGNVAPTSDNGGFCATYSSANATTSSGIPVCSATTPGIADDDVFFTFTVPVAGSVTVYAAGAAGYDPVLQVLSGTPGSFTALACVNATGAGLIETSSATLAVGTYYVRVYDAGTGSGANGAFAAAAFFTPSPPANDECANAILLNSSSITCTSTAGTTIGATASATAACTGAPDDDVWYSFVPATAGDYNVLVTGTSGFNAVLETLTGTCTALTSTNCANSTSTGGNETAVMTGLTAGTTYYVRVYNFAAGSGSGNFSVCVTRACNPVTSASAANLTATSTDITFTAGAGNTGYTVTATPASGPAATATGAASPIALAGLTPNTTYSTVILGNCGPTSSTTFSFTTPFLPPANDNPTGAIALPLATTCTPTSGTNIGATTTTANGYANPDCAIAFSPADVWYTFVTAAGGVGSTSVTVRVNGTPAGQVRVFSAASSAGPFTSVGCANGPNNNTQAPALALTGLTPSTTYYVFVSGYGSGDVRGAFTICAQAVPAPSLVVSTAGQTISGNYNNVTIASGGVATLGSTLIVDGALNVLSGGTLNLNCQTIAGAGTVNVDAGGTLGICDAAGLPAIAGRTFSTDANYVYNGTVAQASGNGLPARVRNLTVNNGGGGLTLSAPTSVRQLLRLQNGGLATGGNALTLLSQDGYGTAVVDNTGGVVTGTATMQRAVDQTPVGTSGNIGYHHYSSPVAATTLADLDVPAGQPGGTYANTYNTAYNTAANPGIVRPFPTVFGYDETRLVSSPATTLDVFSKGWFSPAGTGDAMEVGRGYSANIPNALLVDFVGTLNNGPINVAGLTRGADANAGWHLVGNPYPAPLNWDNVAAARRAGLDGAMYVANSTGPYTGTYRTRANGVGISPLIVAGSGFFVRTIAGQTGGLNLLNADRETTFGAQPAFGRDSRPVLALTLANAAGTQADDAYVYLQAGATAAFDSQFDAAKLPNSTGLNLAAMAGNQGLAINGLPLLTGPALVPLTVGVPAVGSYTLALGQLANFGGTSLVLRDNLTGTRTPLAAGTSYRFAVSAFSTAGRFVLELNPAAGPLASASQVLAAQVQVYPNPSHGRFTLALPAMAGAGTAQATLLNALGQVVQTRTVALTATGTTTEFNTSALSTGVYALTLKLGNETVTRRVVVE